MTYYPNQFQIPLIANSIYISSINALGVSLSLIPMYIHMPQLKQAMPQPIHCMLGLPLLNKKALIMARIKPNQRHPSILL